MHRLGILPEEAEAFYQRLSRCKNVSQPVNIVSHFARADEPESDATLRQLDIFNSFTAGKPGQRSIGASGGILLWPDSHMDWVRPGIILYGVSPLEQKPWGVDFGFQPVMSLTSSLIAVRAHKAGEAVGYGGTWLLNVIRVWVLWRLVMATVTRVPHHLAHPFWLMAVKCRLSGVLPWT